MRVAYPDRYDPVITATSSRYLENPFGGETVLGQRLNRLHDSLWEVFKDCSEANWDGYNARPISDKAFLEALKLLQLLPAYLPSPEIVPEPTGEMGLEWYKGNQFVFVMSLSGNNTITYAGMFGPGIETHGTESFSESLPRTVIENIRRLFPQQE